MTRPLRASLPNLAERARYRLLRGVRIDTRTLAAFRVFVGLLVIADLLLRSRNFSFFYTDDGVVPQSLAMARTPDYAFSFYYLTTDSTAIAALFVVQALVAVQLIVGYKTRIATVVTFLFTVSLDHHNPLVLSYADTLFRMLLFWAIFLPLGERWSIDAVHADREPREYVASLASAAILVQMIYMYFVNGLHKTGSELWNSGEAAVLVLGLDNTTFLLGDLTRNVPSLLQLGGLTWYYMLLFSWLLLLLRGRKRMLLIGMFASGHAAFALTVRIGAFPYVAMAGLLLFLQAQFWSDARAVLRLLTGDDSLPSRAAAFGTAIAERVPAIPALPARLDLLRANLYTATLVVAVVFVLVLPTISLASASEAVDRDVDPARHVDDATSALNVDQPTWSIFAPNPRTTDRYYVFPAVTEDGERYDVYNDRALAYERPYAELQKQYGTYRERFYMNSVRRSGFGETSRRLADHLCEEWTNENGAKLTHVNMYVVEEDVTRDTIDSPSDRDRESRMIRRHGCGDNGHRTIEAPAF